MNNLDRLGLIKRVHVISASEMTVLIEPFDEYVSVSERYLTPNLLFAFLWCDKSYNSVP